MERNVGGYDRIGRFVLGAALVAAGVAGYVGAVRVAVGPLPQALTALLLVLLGFVLLVTGYTRRCAVNSALGIHTSESGRR